MHLRAPRRGRRLVASAATLGLLGLPLLTSTADAAPAAAARTKAPAIKVMTRNVYLGADIMRPIGAMAQAKAEGGTDLDVLNAFANANDMTQDIAVQTDFPARAELLAAELVEHRPDLVGLQEVAMWRQGDGTAMDMPGTPGFLVANATDVKYDFLQILLAELKAQGVVYKAVSINTLSDVEGPAWEGRLGHETFANPRDVRLTMRDVILKRKGSPVTVVKGSARKATYATNMPPIVVSGKEIKFERGYQSIDLMAGDRKFRFVNTHLEAFSSDVAHAQAKELLNGPGAYKGRTIIVCDCNSDPENGTVKPVDTKAHWAPYRLITRGFHDTWLQWALPEEGFTSGLSETVADETAAGFDHRIDMVFARNARGDKLPVLSGDVTGDELTDRNVDGLWPSDHAGVVMKLRLR